VVVKKWLPFVAGAHQPDSEALSAYADNALDATASATLTAHLAQCAACRERLEDIERMQAALASLPDVAHPRSFRLREADVERLGQRGRTATAAGWLSWTPALSGAAVLVFAAVLGFDVVYRDEGADSARLQAASVQTANTMIAERSTADAPAGTLGSDAGAGAEMAPATADSAAPDIVDTPAAALAPGGPPTGRSAFETPTAPEAGVDAPTTAESADAESFSDDDGAAAEAGPPAAPAPDGSEPAIPAPGEVAPAPGGMAPAAPEAAQPTMQDEAGGPAGGAEEDSGPVATGAPTPAAANAGAPTSPADDAQARREECDAACMRDRRIAEMELAAADDDRAADKWFLVAEIIAGTVAAASGAASVVRWMRRREQRA
jgi:hypothetical protein